MELIRILSPIALCSLLSTLASGCAHRVEATRVEHASAQHDIAVYEHAETAGSAHAADQSGPNTKVEVHVYEDDQVAPPQAGTTTVTIHHREHQQGAAVVPGQVGVETLSTGDRVTVVTYVHHYPEPIEHYSSVYWAGRWYYNVHGQLVYWDDFYGGWVYYWGPPLALVSAWNHWYPSAMFMWGHGFYGAGWYWGGVAYTGFHVYGVPHRHYRPIRVVRRGKVIRRAHTRPVVRVNAAVRGRGRARPGRVHTRPVRSTTTRRSASTRARATRTTRSRTTRPTRVNQRTPRSATSTTKTRPTRVNPRSTRPRATTKPRSNQRYANPNTRPTRTTKPPTRTTTHHRSSSKTTAKPTRSNSTYRSSPSRSSRPRSVNTRPQRTRSSSRSQRSPNRSSNRSRSRSNTRRPN